MAEEAFHITTVKTEDLCKQLDCTKETDDLDGALSDSEYVRLDHGIEPGPNLAIMKMSPPAGRDPGHRGPAIAFASNLFYIIHANGKPEAERLRKAVETVLEVLPTDIVGEKVITALAAYSAKKDPGRKPLITSGPYAISAQAMAAIAYETARYANVITDVSIERIREIGGYDEDWTRLVYSNMKADEPVHFVKKHDAAEYEKMGLEPQVAELIAWIKAKPDIQKDDFIRYAQDVGLDAHKAARKIATAFGVLPMLTHEDQIIENGIPSSSI